MPRSAAFVRIKADVLSLVGEIPSGRVCTYAEIGRTLDVMARHVAYILATLTDDEREHLPWHRVVAADGKLNTTKHGRGTDQKRLLEAEGIVIGSRNTIVELDSILWSPEPPRA